MGRGRPRTIDRVRVATIALEALELGLPMIQTVSTTMNVNKDVARGMLAAARKEGLLGRDGHVPASAMIHRFTDRERRWLVCERCLTPWPCSKGRVRKKGD